MKVWNRTAKLSAFTQSTHKETWEYSEGGRSVAAFEVDVRRGKPLDVLGLKNTSLEEIRDYAAFLQKTATELYAPHRGKNEVTACPCCDAGTQQALDAFSIFGVGYKRCWQCGHGFVGSQPTFEVLSEVFAESADHAGVYTDLASLEIRLSQVIKPKLDWVQKIYQQRYSRTLTSVLDVGAGGGHFVEVAKRAGLRADGYEVSKASRQFAKSTFGLDLRNNDFLTEEGALGEFDMLTFWGLLEYTPEPKRFIEVARRRLNPQQGMLVIEVPRFDCLGTRIQKERPQTVARHLDPTTHVNCFSDASLATALYLSGFKPVAAWYFGMDAYELFVQLALQLGDDSAFEQFADLIPGLQASIDSAQFCDDIIVAAVPLN